MSDFLIYLIADAGYAGRQSLSHIVEEAILGGVTAVQYRDKMVDADRMVVVAKELRRVTRDHGVVLIVNDRPEVAVEAGADGVHVGQTDMAAADVRELVGAEMVVGVTARTSAQIEEAARAGADYVGFGPVFPTTTKEDAAPVAGMDRLRVIACNSSIPVIAIGGITVGTAAEAIEAGAGGIAVCAAIMGAENPRSAAARFREAVAAKDE